MNFPNDEEYISVRDIIKFYLISCPCERSSSRGMNVSLWGKPNIILWGKIKSQLGFEREKNYEWGNSKPKMKELFFRYGLNTDFTDVVNDTIVFIKDGNVFESPLKHIRSSIAHSRWQVRDDIFYFEDGSDDVVDGITYFSVTARIVLKRQTLLDLRDLIISGPSDEELEKINFSQMIEEFYEKLRLEFGEKGFTRKEAIEVLGIDDDALWVKLYKRGKEDECMVFVKNKWRMKRKPFAMNLNKETGKGVLVTPFYFITVFHNRKNMVGVVL